MLILIPAIRRTALTTAVLAAAFLALTVPTSAQRAAVEVSVDNCPAPSTPIVTDPPRAERPPPELSMSVKEVDAVAQRLDQASQRKLLDMGQRLGISSLNASTPPSDLMVLLFTVLQETIDEMNKDKQYWVNKLKALNAMANAVDCYLDQVDGHVGGKSGESTEIRVDASAWRAAVPDYAPPATVKTPDALAAEVKKWERVQNEIKAERKHANAQLEEALQAESRVQADVATVLSVIRK